MIEEEWKKRMANSQYNDLVVTTHEDNKPYVFISYKSDSWELVLTEIVYTLQKKYGLRLYFDKSFNNNNNIWTEQFPLNMKDVNCKAVLAFIDNKYYSSYATLLELMYSQTHQASVRNKRTGLPVIPVNLETIKDISDELGKEDTGLGVETFGDGTKNLNANAEKKLFDDTFKQLEQREFWEQAQYAYEGENLSKFDCQLTMGELYKNLKISDNIYKSDMEQKYFYDSLVNTIKSVAPEVFDDSNVDLSDKVDELATDKNKVQEIKWRDFESIQSFSYNNKYFNTSNAQQAYAAIVDVIKQNNPSLDTKSIICGETPFFVKLAGGNELDMINGGYGNILKNVPEIKNADIKLYSSKLENAQQVKAYEILKREKVALNPEYFTDDIKMFNTYFTKLSKKYSESWTKSNGQGKTPSINMDIKLRFECDYLEQHTIKGYKWKPIFTEMMNYFFEISGESYYDYAVKLCNKLGIAEPLVINADVYETRIKDKSRYASVAENNFYFLNSYSAKDIVKAIIKQISMYYEYLKAKQINADISKVYVDYKIDDKEISNMMMDIRKNIDDLEARPISPTSELVSFNSESFSEFVLRFLRISKAYKEDWKRTNKGNTPAIPFVNIKIYMSEDIVKNSEITANNWKPLFNKVMDELYVSANGEYCEYRKNEEARKNIKTPSVVTKSDYEEGRIPRERYQPIAEGQYYFFNSYAAPDLIKALRDEIKMYIDFVNRNKGTQAGMEEIFISYSLPKGEYADMFS